MRWLRKTIVGVSMAVLAAAATICHIASSREPSLPANDVRIALGQKIFNDPQLSADHHVRCATCHQPDRDYSDGRVVAIGVFNRPGTRNTPSLLAIASAQYSSFFWDGRRDRLDEAVLDPLTNPQEMGMRDVSDVLKHMNASADYRSAFKATFNRGDETITAQEVSEALVAFVSSLGKRPSAYDQYRAGDLSALSPQAKEGLGIFEGNGHCAECHLLQGHVAPLTDHQFHESGVGQQDIANTLPNLTKGVIDRSLQGNAIGMRVAANTQEAQLGRFNVTREPMDVGLFRTPSLRNVSRTAPYMHDGSVATLDEAMDREIYYRGLQTGHPVSLTVEEKKMLKMFLETL